MSSFHPFEVTPVHLIYVGLGIFIVLFGMFSLFIKEKLYLGEAPLAAIFGIIVGPVALNLFTPSSWASQHEPAPGGHITDEITLEIMRVTIALSVFAVGVELPKKYLLRHWKSIALLLGPVMVWGWLVTAAFMYALVPGLDFLNCLVVASCVTPTDPILAQAVVGGPWAEKHVPAHLRHMLMCESGCNDGAAFPFLYLALFLTTNRDNHGKAIAEWFYDAWAYQIIFGTILGALIGWAARKLMRFSERNKLVDRESFVAQYVSLAIASMGVNVLLGSDDLLAAFACGTAFAWDGWFTRQTEDSNFSSIVDLLFNVATFIYIGALMPFGAFAGGSEAEPNTLNLWRLFVLAICVLLTKRLPIVVLLWRWIPDIKTFREAVFAGHFGPIGVGAIFIATLARTLLPEEVHSPPQTTNDILALTVQPIIFFFVLCSIIIHGLTIPFFAFSRRATTMTRTWSRNPSFMAGDDQPGWISKLRRSKTGESIAPEEGNMTEIERVLNAQLGRIGRGAIGGDAEKELRGEETSGEEESNTVRNDGSDSSRVGLFNTRTEREMQEATDDYDEDHALEREDPVGEWGGDDTIEMRRYRQKMLESKEGEYARLRQRQQDADERNARGSDERQDHSRHADLGMAGLLSRTDDEGEGNEPRAPMDRDINSGRIQSSDEDEDARLDREGQARWGCGTDGNDEYRKEEEVKEEEEGEEEEEEEREHAALLKEREKDSCYPRSRTWVEGSKLVIEYQASKSSDCEVVVIPIQDHERDTITSAEDPAHAWVQVHAPKIEQHLGLQDVASWSPRDAANYLMHHRIPHLYNEYLSRRLKRRDSESEESKEVRDQRSQMLYESLNWAAARRSHSPEHDISSSSSLLANGGGASSQPPQLSGAAVKSEKRRKYHRPPSPEEEEPPISGWLAAEKSKPKPKKPQRRSSGSPIASPIRGSSRIPASFGKKFVSRPSASDSRRLELRKKVCAGELSLGTACQAKDTYNGEGDVEMMQSPLDANDSRIIPSSSAKVPESKYMPRSASAGGLGPSSPSPIKRWMHSSQSAKGALSIPRPRTMESSAGSLSIPRTRTTESSTGSLSIPRTRTLESSTSSLKLPQTETQDSTTSEREERRREHRKSHSVQWLDISDSTHNHHAPSSPNLSGRERIDLARVGGGITPRSGSRNPSPTRQSDREARGHDDSERNQSGSRKNRLVSLISAFTAPTGSSSLPPTTTSGSSSNPLVRVIRPGEKGIDDSGDLESTSSQASRSFGSHLTPPSRSGTGEGGILAPPSRTATADVDDPNTSTSTATPGVTFNL